MGTLRGILTEKRFVTIALELGWDVAVPANPQLPYDIVVCIDGIWKRVQVKTVLKDSGRRSVGGFIAPIRKSSANRQYIEGDFDFLAAVRWPIACYLFPFSEVKKRSASIYLGKNAEQFKIWPEKE